MSIVLDIAFHREKHGVKHRMRVNETKLLEVRSIRVDVLNWESATELRLKFDIGPQDGLLLIVVQSPRLSCLPYIIFAWKCQLDPDQLNRHIGASKRVLLIGVHDGSKAVSIKLPKLRTSVP